MRGRAGILCGLALAQLLPASAPMTAPVTELTVATYNVANYNLTDRQIEGAFLTQYPKPEREKAALRRVIRALDVDVLALQEIGGEPFLRELQRDLRSEGADYPYAHVLAAADDVRRVAILSRVPFASVVDHTDLEFRYFEGRERVKRGLLEVRFATVAGEVTVYVVHLKSRLTERRDDPASEERRGREATAVRDRVLEQWPDPGVARFLILGDFNAGPDERPARAFAQRGELVISALLPATDARGETWTHFYRRADIYSRVDCVMVSPGLAAAAATPAEIYDGPGVLVASDHRPVKVRLRFDAQPESRDGAQKNRRAEARRLK